MTKRARCRVTTRFPTEANLTASTINQLTTLINAVYDDAEAGMWKRPGRAPTLVKWNGSSATTR